MDRRKFLKVTGSITIGGLVLSVVGTGIWKMFTAPEDLFYDSRRLKGLKLVREDKDFISPYRRTFGFLVPDDITALEVEGGSIYVATPNNIYIYGMSGELQTNFSIPSDLRDIALYQGRVYALFANRIEVYDRNGDVVQEWSACSENSDYCSLAVCDAGVFATDASNKNICKYHLDGSLACFINSPKGFVVPSYCFGITIMDGKIYCSNPGRHQVECYTLEGEYITAFGKSGAGQGAFSGCCNPVYLTPANNGELLTSEKGIPRISCYSRDGKFRSVLLDSKALGGGHAAYEVRIIKDKLIVAGGNKVAVYQYNKNQSQETRCGQCQEDCPLKV